MSCFSSCFYSRRKFQPTDTTNPMRKRNGVYLSFHGVDYLRSSFVSGLYTTLRSASEILRFVDYDRLTTTDQEMPFSESSLNIIGECEIAIVIFSKNYTNSRPCLQELEKITKYSRTTPGLSILPFVVNMEEGMYGRAFHDFLDRVWIEEISKEEDKFMTWLAAFTKDAKYSTRSLYLEGNFKKSFRNDSEYIKEVVEHVTAVLNKRGVSSSFDRERINSCAQDVIQLLKQSNHPLLLGIWGVEGIGKTTIAQTIYDQIGPYFEHKCFIKDTRRDWEQGDRLLIKIPITIESTKVFRKEKLQHKRVLIIIDDVYKLEQLNVVCGSREWFGPGSKIIITTTNRHLLKEHGVDHIYQVKELDESESLELFNLSAFRETTTPREDFGELCRQVVAYSRGLPLALEELGSFLNGKEALQWKI